MLIGLVAILPAFKAWGAGCPTRTQPMIDLEVISDRGEASDRTQRIRVHDDGCVTLQRPPAFRVPGVFAVRIDDAQLQSLRRHASDPYLRAIDPHRVLAEARSASQAPAQSEQALRRTYVSHPTWYVLRLDAAGEIVELKVESVFQHAQLHPQSRPLAELASVIAEVLALDGAAEPAGEVQR